MTTTFKMDDGSNIYRNPIKFTETPKVFDKVVYNTEPIIIFA